MRSSKRASSRAIAAPTSPAPTIATSYRMRAVYQFLTYADMDI